MQICLSFVLSTTIELYILIQSSHSILWPLKRNPWHQSSIPGICQAIPLGCFFCIWNTSHRHLNGGQFWPRKKLEPRLRRLRIPHMLFSKGLHICERTRTRTGHSPRNNPVMHSYIYIYIYIRGPPAKSQKMPKLPPSETTKCKKVSAGPHVCLVSTIFNTHHAASHAYMRDA